MRRIATQPLTILRKPLGPTLLPYDPDSSLKIMPDLSAWWMPFTGFSKNVVASNVVAAESPFAHTQRGIWSPYSDSFVFLEVCQVSRAL